MVVEEEHGCVNHLFGCLRSDPVVVVQSFASRQVIKQAIVISGRERDLCSLQQLQLVVLAGHVTLVAHGLMLLDRLCQDLWQGARVRLLDLKCISDVLHGRVVTFLGLRLVLANHRVSDVASRAGHHRAENRSAFLVGVAGLVLVNAETDLLWR